MTPPPNPLQEAGKVRWSVNTAAAESWRALECRQGTAASQLQFHPGIFPRPEGRRLADKWIIRDDDHRKTSRR